MTRLNCKRKGCKDVWNAFLVADASYAGPFEFPVIQPESSVPKRLIAFSEAVGSKDHDQWVHFFEDDYLFERIWRNPKRYLEILKHFNGVIMPDFSVYRDMPYAMQLWNIYRSRAIGFWLQKNGVKVIVNIRYGDIRTYAFCCDGAPRCCTIAVGTHGTLKYSDDKKHFVEGLELTVTKLRPTTIVVYGAAPESVFDVYRERGIEVVQFDSDFARAHGGE
jgi:hypothetical protein